MQNFSPRHRTQRKIIYFGILLLSVLFCACNPIQEQDMTATESITLIGPDSTYPAVRLLAEAYMKAHPGDRIHFLPSVHSAAAIAGVIDGTANMGIISRELTPEEERNLLCRYPFARDLLVFAAHPEVPVRKLSTKDLLAIYAGRITNWKELGGTDQMIVVLDRPEYTSAKKKIRNSVFGKNFSITPAARILEHSGQMDHSLRNIPGSIGYTSYSNLFALDFEVPPLQIDGILPSPENQGAQGADRLRQYSFVVLGRPLGLVKRFINAIYSPSGQELLRKNGLLPEHRKLTLALMPVVNIMDTETGYLPLIDYLSRKSRIPIEVRYTASYGEAVRDFLQGEIDGAFLGSFTYTLVKRKIPLEILARPEIGGQAYYTGILFVRQDSGIRKLEDLRGKTFCFVDRASTAGYLFPLHYFREAGIVDYENFFGKTLFAGSHDASILNVLNGKADAGVAKDLVLMKAGEKDTRIALDLLMMATSVPIPTNGLCVRRGLDWDLKKDLKEVLLQMEEDPEGRNVLKRFGADRFLPTTDQDYENLYTLLDELKIDPATFDYENP